MNIIIVGGKGFIGSHIVYRLSLKHNIVIIDGWTTSYPGFSMIHRGSKGLEPVSELEKEHRNIALHYRNSLIKGIRCIDKWTFNNFMDNYTCIFFNDFLNCSFISLW